MRKLASMLLAMALARSVFPVPGGPYRSTPWWQRGEEGSRWNPPVAHAAALGAGRRLFARRTGVGTRLWRLDSHAEEDLRVQQRKLDGLAKVPNLVAQPADGGVVYLPRSLVEHVVDHWVHLLCRQVSPCHRQGKTLARSLRLQEGAMNGRTSRGSARMIVSVVMSRATRVPCVSFALSSFVLHPTT